MADTTWTIHADRNLLHVKYRGALDTGTLTRSFEAFTADPDWRVELDRIYDLTAIDAFDAADFRAEEIMRAARRTIDDDSDSSARIVVVAPDDVAFALHRVFAVFRGLPEERFMVVRSLAEACAFLGVDPVGLSAGD